jgi:hypothetical protein
MCEQASRIATITLTTKKQTAKNDPRNMRLNLSFILRAQPNPPNKLQMTQKNNKTSASHPWDGPFWDSTNSTIRIGARPTPNHLRVVIAPLLFGLGFSSIFFLTHPQTWLMTFGIWMGFLKGFGIELPNGNGLPSQTVWPQFSLHGRRRISNHQATILPLPAGEGRGGPFERECRAIHGEGESCVGEMSYGSRRGLRFCLRKPRIITAK